MSQIAISTTDRLLLDVSEEALTLRSKRKMARRAQRMAQQFLSEDEDSLSDELLADRKEEARRENGD